MKKLLFFTLLSTMPAFAADWTPYLKGMQDSCNYGSTFVQILRKEVAMPNALKADVVSHRNISPYEDESVWQLQLKNATAFGYPLKSIEYASYPESYLTLKFAQVNASALLPKFYFKIGNKTLTAGTPSAKALLIEYRYNERTNQSELVSVKEINNQKNRSDFIDHYFNTHQLENGFDMTIARATQNGWEDGNPEYGNYLTFSQKDKSLTCGGYYP